MKLIKNHKGHGGNVLAELLKFILVLLAGNIIVCTIYYKLLKKVKKSWLRFLFSVVLTLLSFYLLGVILSM